MAYKKIASSFRKFLFFEKEESTSLSSGRLCISTKSHKLISETVQVDINNESFEVSVQEIGSWSTKIKYDYNDIFSNHDLKEVDHVSESNDEQPIDNFEILQTKLNNMDEQAFDNELGTEGDKKDGENRYSIDSPKKKVEEDTNFSSTNLETKDNSSDLSRPPGFEFMKKSFSSSRNCSTSFARRRKNDIKGFSLLSELNQIIDVGSSLGYDVRGWNWKNIVGDRFMVNIYGPQDHVSKLPLWNRLTDFMHHHNGSYIMFGDMNAVRNAQERFGTTLNSIEADHFNSFIDSTGLVDLPISGRSFTWMNKAGTNLSKLDRFLILEDVTIRIPDVRITTLDRLWSDHNLIFLRIDKTDFGPTPFKLYNSWLLRDGFDNLIKEEWELLDSNLKCHEKFRRLKDKIK
ncbi:RNA-directed DNA polymerase, eukaryota, reverse transcriptase zinc-binding domain protein [Tanacetum coccineum]